MPRRVRRIILGVVAAVMTYVLFIVVATGAALLEGDGLSCSEASCGPIARFFDDAAPWPMVVAIAAAVIVGLRVAWPRDESGPREPAQVPRRERRRRLRT